MAQTSTFKEEIIFKDNEASFVVKMSGMVMDGFPVLEELQHTMITFVPNNVEGDDLVYKPETVEKNKEACKHCVEKSTIDSDCIDDVTFFFKCASRLKELNLLKYFLPFLICTNYKL
ncbi:hypothetical protein NC651_039404 [Populus alba x Populus x berolinensis]|nr:hypothetical protein NC651_039404 [Populus alba x Populus x berolinensis]